MKYCIVVVLLSLLWRFGDAFAPLLRPSRQVRCVLEPQRDVYQAYVKSYVEAEHFQLHVWRRYSMYEIGRMDGVGGNVLPSDSIFATFYVHNSLHEAYIRIQRTAVWESGRPIIYVYLSSCIYIQRPNAQSR